MLPLNALSLTLTNIISITKHIYTIQHFLNKHFMSNRKCQYQHQWESSITARSTNEGPVVFHSPLSSAYKYGPLPTPHLHTYSRENQAYSSQTSTGIDQALQLATATADSSSSSLLISSPASTRISLALKSLPGFLGARNLFRGQ